MPIALYYLSFGRDLSLCMTFCATHLLKGNTTDLQFSYMMASHRCCPRRFYCNSPHYFRPRDVLSNWLFPQKFIPSTKPHCGVMYLSWAALSKYLDFISMIHCIGHELPMCKIQSFGSEGQLKWVSPLPGDETLSFCGRNSGPNLTTSEIKLKCVPQRRSLFLTMLFGGNFGTTDFAREDCMRFGWPTILDLSVAVYFVNTLRCMFGCMMEYCRGIRGWKKMMVHMQE